MQYYTLGFCTEEADILDSQDNRQYWMCQAENEEHAIEQLLNAEPTCNWKEVIEVSDTNPTINGAY